MASAARRKSERYLQVMAGNALVVDDRDLLPGGESLNAVRLRGDLATDRHNGRDLGPG
jgi:hypothetical protein